MKNYDYFKILQCGKVRIQIRSFVRGKVRITTNYDDDEKVT